MTIYHAKDATIEFSIDGKDWQEIRGIDWATSVTSTPLAGLLVARDLISSWFGVYVPFVQEQAAAAARAEQERWRSRFSERADPPYRYLYSLIGTHAKFNRGKFTALAGGHTRHAMRHRKLRRYRQTVGSV